MSNVLPLDVGSSPIYVKLSSKSFLTLVWSQKLHRAPSSRPQKYLTSLLYILKAIEDPKKLLPGVRMSMNSQKFILMTTKNFKVIENR